MELLSVCWTVAFELFLDQELISYRYSSCWLLLLLRKILSGATSSKKPNIVNTRGYRRRNRSQRQLPRVVYKAKGEGRYSCSWEPHLRATGRHLPYGITHCYLPPDTSERAPPIPSHAGRYSIYLPRRDGRLSWRSWLDSAPAGSCTSDLSITSPTPLHHQDNYSCSVM